MFRRPLMVMLVLSVFGCSAEKTTEQSDVAKPSAPAKVEVTPQPLAKATPPIKKDEAPSATEPAKQTGANGLDAALAAWQAGSKDEAVKLLLGTQGEDLAAGSSLRVFQLSESDVKGLPQAEKTSLQKEVIAIAPQIKRLATEGLRLGDELLSKGDVENARLHFEAVNRLGKTLKAPQRLQILQSFDFVTPSEEGLSRCKQAMLK